MSEWSTKFLAHPIFVTLDELHQLAVLDKKESVITDGPDFRRLRKIFSTVKSMVMGLDPEILNFGTLDNLNSLLNSDIKGPLTIKVDAGDSDVNGIGDRAVEIYAEHAKLALSVANKEHNDAVANIEAELDLLLERAEQHIANTKGAELNLLEVADQLSTSIAATNSETILLSEQLSSIRSSGEELQGTWQAQFSEAQNQRSTEFTSLLTISQTEAAAMITDERENLRNTIETTRSETQVEMNDLKVDVQNWHEEILDIYQLVAADSVGAGYLKNAQEERQAANFWRWGAIVFIVMAVAWLVYITDGGIRLEGSDESNSVSEVPTLFGRSFFTSIGVVGSLLFGAAFSASQSSKHRNFEQRARRFGLEMKALNPFLSGMGDSDVLAIKKELATKIFGKFDLVSPKGEKISDHTQMKYIAELFEKMLKQGTS